MPDKLTDTEIKKAYELCFAEKGTSYTCAVCPYHQFGELCKVNRDKDALDLINRQEVRIHQQEKTIMEIQNANLINLKATIGNYIAENESLITEIERLWLCIDELKKLVGKHEPNYDPSEEVDAIIQSTTMVETPNIKANIKAEAYKEAFGKVKEELKNIAKIDWQGGYYYLVGEAFF